MKFIHLSPTTDFSSELQSLLRIINGNILYITRELDQVKKIVNSLEINSRLQNEADSFYKGEAHLGPDSEDSSHEEDKEPD